MGTRVVVAGGGPVASRVCALTAADPAVDRVVVLGAGSDPTTLPAGVETVVSPLAPDAVADVLAGADTLVHLGATSGPDLDGAGGSELDLAATRRLLGAAADAGVRQLVVRSTAMVYGAWSNNPVPLTEEAPLRPDPNLPYAVLAAELERVVGEWRVDVPSASVAVLRPVVAVGPERSAWLGASPWSRAGVQPVDAEAPAQFLHLDDLAAALDVARRSRLDGAYNVAPDGWLAAEQVRALDGPARRVRMPSQLARGVARLRFALGLSPVPPPLIAYTLHPWVVANDRLRAAGWSPQFTNEEAFVDADQPGRLASMSTRHRQELSLAVVGAAVVAAVAGVVALVRRRRGRR